MVAIGGYIDSAIVSNKARIRYDSAYNNPFPDRAEFFYPECGCFPNAAGPPLPESSVDYQDIETYLELAAGRYASAFVELPVRFINPVANDNTAGLGDVRAGFKYALLAESDRWLTLQFRGYFPTGDGDRGLGTEHVSLEPGVLYQSTHDRLTLLGEFRTWIPVGGSKEEFPLAANLGGPGGTVRNYAGTILRYGMGTGYDFYRSHDRCTPVRATLVSEFVGWTILDGLKEHTLTPFEPIETSPGVLNPAFVEEYESARGDTIVNLKIGVRLSSNDDSLYFGYGKSLTNDIWYSDMLRAEYSYLF
jgi:hypothetical protein